MEERNNCSDKVSFKVRFLGEYHDIVIDWNDDRYEYKPQQVFEQLESITGILSKYTLSIVRHVTQVFDQWQPADILNNSIIYRDGRDSSLDGSSFVDGEQFHLAIAIVYDSGDYSINRIGVYYRLLPISEVPEGVCSQYVCKHKNTEGFLDKVRDLVNNDELNLKISNRIQSMGRHWTTDWDNVYKEFNVQQYLRTVCDFHRKIDLTNNRRQQVDLYLRTRG